MEPFTEEEKPNWMRMQLPGGRPMVDCMRAVDGLDIKPRGRKRKVTYKEEPDSQSGKEAASTSSQELPPLPRPSVPSRHVPILPRPSSTESRESPSSQPTAPLPKRKRGRPLYADSCNRQTALPLAQFSPKYIAKFPIKGLFHPQAKSLMSNSQMSGQPQHLTILLFLPTHAQLWLVEMREDSSLGLKTASRAP
ncbi:hypothetical protein NW757_004966 [Fusarium falciforme]|nr:hypothetical protein NW757_004966 [Fusarium falciforme]